MSNEIEQDENRLIAQRREKLDELRTEGNAFPNDFRRNVMNAELTVEYADTDAEALKASTRRVKIAGRLMTKRVMGKASFATVRDMSGDMQLYVKRDDLTGTALSGNKIRKLEFVLAEALAQKADTVITCGGAQLCGTVQL